MSIQETQLTEFERACDIMLNCIPNGKRTGTKDTPKRFAKAFSFLFDGYGKEDTIPEMMTTFADGAKKYNNMIVQNDIPVWSMCEHHILPFFGVSHIGYIPKGKIIGLSKLSRIIDIFARRLQVQERLTVQIADTLQEHLNPKGVGVVLQCRHSCMECRGVQKANTQTTTSHLAGVMTDQEVRAEFLSFIK